MLTQGEMLTEIQARAMAAQIEEECAGHVKVLAVFCPAGEKYWWLRVLLVERELVQVLRSQKAWDSIRNAWNVLVPALGPAPGCLHRWVRLPGSVGLFQCIRCVQRGVCPGCLNSLRVALVASDAGFSVHWCKQHSTPSREHLLPEEVWS